MKQVTIIDYGSGNLHSIAKAFEHEAAPLGIKVKISSNSEDINNASHVVLPGVGAFADCLNGLKSAPGVLASMEKAALADKKPFLGVCVGMQMLAEESLEQGKHNGLGWIKGKVIGIDSNKTTLKVPHMGWNNLVVTKQHPILKGIKTGDHAYFVHSYWMDCGQDNILANVDYGTAITAVIANNNIVATQFHPEKSQELGLKILKGFGDFVKKA